MSSLVLHFSVVRSGLSCLSTELLLRQVLLADFLRLFLFRARDEFLNCTLIDRLGANFLVRARFSGRLEGAMRASGVRIDFQVSTTGARWRAGLGVS